MISPHRSGLVAARIRLEQLRASAEPCARCAELRARRNETFASFASLVGEIAFGLLAFVLVIIFVAGVAVVLLLGLVALLFSGPIAHA